MGKAAASVVINHPVLGEVQVFNTHVRPWVMCCSSAILMQKIDVCERRGYLRPQTGQCMGVCEIGEAGIAEWAICYCSAFYFDSRYYTVV